MYHSQEESPKQSTQIPSWTAKKSQINHTKGIEDVKAHVIHHLVFLSCI